jgi:hypothetical protein
MEALTRIVSDSLARHGFNRPPDPRRLQWSRWSLCDSLHSLLVVPSKPGIFAIAEEVCRASDALLRPEGTAGASPLWGGAALQRCETGLSDRAASAAEGKRMLAVLQFSEDDDMAFTLDRMFTKPNPMRERLAAGCCFLRFVVIEDEDHRRSICSALNQWLLSSAEKASGIPGGFSSSLEIANVERAPSPALLSNHTDSAQATKATVQPAHLDSGFNENRHCLQPFPSGF